MIIYDPTVQERYAQAFFGVAKRRGNTGPLLEEIEALLPQFVFGSKLRVFLEAPQISTEDKQRLLDRAFKDQAEPLVYQLLSLLLKKGRIEYVEPVLKRFRILVERDQGLYEAEVATAVELDEGQRKQLQTELERFTKVRLRIRYSVRPELIGGVWFKYGDTMIDDTVRGKLDRLRYQLLEAARA